METQPLVLLLQTVAKRLLGEDAILPDALSLTLLMVGLQWWAMWSKQYTEHTRRSERSWTAFSVIGAFTAVIIYSLTHIFWIENSGFLTLSLLLLIWFWYRSIYWARDPLNSNNLTTAFKIGFSVLLVLLIFAVLSSLGNDPTLSQSLERALPIFFLSGLIALSFARIGTVQKERDPYSLARESTGSWITGLTVAWILLIVVSVLFESFPLEVISSLFNPLWFVLGLIGAAIFYLLSFLVYGFVFVIVVVFAFLNRIIHFQQPQQAPDPKKNAITVAEVVKHADSGSPWLGRALVIVIFLLLILLLIRIMFISRRKQAKRPEHEEEVRESLDRSAILQQRRQDQARRQQDRSRLEALDAASVRARYRDFLQTMQEKGGEFSRQPSETPLEYQQRLIDVATRKRLLRQDDPLADPALLAELTHAYEQERYGGKQTDSSTLTSLNTSVPQLTRRLTSALESAPAKTGTGWSVEKARWGED